MLRLASSEEGAAGADVAVRLLLLLLLLPYARRRRNEAKGSACWRVTAVDDARRPAKAVTPRAVCGSSDMAERGAS